MIMCLCSSNFNVEKKHTMCRIHSIWRAIIKRGLIVLCTCSTVFRTADATVLIVHGSDSL